MCGVDPRTRGRRTDESLHVRTAVAGRRTAHPQRRVLQLRTCLDSTGAAAADSDSDRRPRRRGDAHAPRCMATAGSASGVRRNATRRRWQKSQHELRRSAGRHRCTTASSCGSASTTIRRTRARAWPKGMERFYRIPFERFEKYSPFGTPEVVADALARYRDAGCRLFNLMPVAADPETGIAAVAEIKRLLGRSNETRRNRIQADRRRDRIHARRVCRPPGATNRRFVRRSCWPCYSPLWHSGWGVSRSEIAFLLATLAFVLTTELLNSAIEAVVDRASPELNELAGRAKDMGSAAVFVSLTTVVVVWSMIAVDRLCCAVSVRVRRSRSSARCTSGSIDNLRDFPQRIVAFAAPVQAQVEAA